MKDNFSNQADLYAKYRPRYPRELFEFINSNVDSKINAWDVGTGNGQVAVVLSNHFENIYATDISQKQLDQAPKAPNIHYSLQSAEDTGFSDNTFNLITVAQAIHWFDFNSFYRQVKRTATVNGVLAVWGYSLLEISAEIDTLVQYFYTSVIGSYWDKERKLVDQKYTTIPFPFEEIKSPSFYMDYQWKLNEFEGYLNTWSSVQKYIQMNRQNPVEEFIKKLTPVWGEGKREVRFPIFMRLGKVK